MIDQRVKYHFISSFYEQYEKLMEEPEPALGVLPWEKGPALVDEQEYVHEMDRDYDKFIKNL